MKNLKKDLQTVVRELKALTKKVDKLIAATGKVEKPRAAKKAVVKKTTVKKVVKKAPVKKTVKPAAKKTIVKKKAKVTAIDTVLSIINRSKKGVDVAGLKKKTGYDAPKIYTAVKSLKKKGKIKSARMGIYVKV